MFKGILPSKRISSSDFTIIAGPGISGDVPQFGKEIQNQPDVIPQTALKSGKSTKGFSKSDEKEKTSKAKEKTPKAKEKGRDQSGEPIVTEEAFVKLLVRMMKFLRPQTIDVWSVQG